MTYSMESPCCGAKVLRRDDNWPRPYGAASCEVGSMVSSEPREVEAWARLERAIEQWQDIAQRRALSFDELRSSNRKLYPNLRDVPPVFRREAAAAGKSYRDAEEIVCVLINVRDGEP